MPGPPAGARAYNEWSWHNVAEEVHLDPLGEEDGGREESETLGREGAPLAVVVAEHHAHFAKLFLAVRVLQVRVEALRSVHGAVASGDGDGNADRIPAAPASDSRTWQA